MFLESGKKEVCKKFSRAKSPSATVGSSRYDLGQVAFSALSDHIVHSFQDSKKTETTEGKRKMEKNVCEKPQEISIFAPYMLCNHAILPLPSKR